ncbi:aspartate-semialdehyde dehydrogenase [Nitrobacter vulgaris]|uniref:Aspartate-semialdehyde dehydrogenase n=1 Tax=Nitrobacter vulgaris TaxID=29421 RepID=A0A1V4HV47_NITVU|nr:aspartate-semialdehyde dehydrogenase [Nitrobacter vulgaris]MDR6304355.1 aspartate-semialdehyde dehydrogenase [Nitrobacter vulgaris]OPH81705.1 aspartate-semialdehyde dehydrogenase [Nitrobacter vulgaris]
MGYKVALVGATGNVGREMLNILDERKFPADEVVALASRRSVGTEVSYGDKTLKVKALENHDFGDTDICLMSAGGAVSKEWSPKIAAAGAVVIDNSSTWRMDPDVPLIVPEVNADAVASFAKKNIIANPNCSTAQLVVALKPLHDKAVIRRVVVATYQSVSGAGKDGMDELFAQTKAVYTASELVAKKFPKRIAFNVIPEIDVFMEDGYTKEEWKMMAETKKILDPKIRLTATCVRVPVFIGHSEAVSIEFENPITADEARRILRNAPGCLVIDKHEPGGYVTPYESAGEDATYISRIREDATVENGLSMWVVSDNLRKGAALNAIQIAECLINRKLISAKQKAA